MPSISARLPMMGATAVTFSTSRRSPAVPPSAKALAAPLTAWCPSVRRRSAVAQRNCMPVGRDATVSSASPKARRLLSSLATTEKLLARGTSSGEDGLMSPVLPLMAGRSRPKQQHSTGWRAPSITALVAARRPAHVRRSDRAPLAWIRAKTASRGAGPAAAAAAFSPASQSPPPSCFCKAGMELTAEARTRITSPTPKWNWMSTVAYPKPMPRLPSRSANIVQGQAPHVDRGAACPPS
mmetsp:Transcript_41886/g.125195  ORF Transcript_41886/g.125195 Transcript_41886/m.125195 type:complete len:239 (-) Transcript_41886:137-853(-)